MSKTADMPVFLVPYEASWRAQFMDEAAQIESLFKAGTVTVEHIGSTAIPGLEAKPIIDIMVLIDSIADAPRYTVELETLEYHYHPYGEDVFPERRWHCKPNARNRTHHLHLVEAGSTFQADHLLFRDFLRASSQDALAYQMLKRGLAEKYPRDREAYTEGKSDFVASIVARAKEEIA